MQKQKKYTEKDFEGGLVVKPSITALSPGTVIYVEEDPEITKIKMKTKSWSSGIGKGRHYILLRSDGRFATCLPISSKPPRNPFQVVYKDTIRSGKTLTIRCDEVVNIDIKELTKGQHKNFSSIAYTIDKETTKKLIAMVFAFMTYESYTTEEMASAFTEIRDNLPELIVNFKTHHRHNNMNYSFDDDVDTEVDNEEPECECESDDTTTPDPIEAPTITEEESPTPSVPAIDPKIEEELSNHRVIINDPLGSGDMAKQIENISAKIGPAESKAQVTDDIKEIQKSNICFYINKYWKPSDEIESTIDLMDFVKEYRDWTTEKGVHPASISEIIHSLEACGFKAQRVAPINPRNKLPIIALLAVKKTSEEMTDNTADSDIPPYTRNGRGINWTDELKEWALDRINKGDGERIAAELGFVSLRSLRSSLYKLK